MGGGGGGGGGEWGGGGGGGGGAWPTATCASPELQMQPCETLACLSIDLLTCNFLLGYYIVFSVCHRFNSIVV